MNNVYRPFAMLLLGMSLVFTSCEKEPKSVPVTGISLDSSSLTLAEGETARLTATISPSNADNQGVIWSSSNASVASVSNGTVTAVSAGSATITAKSDDGGKTATCNVTVNSKIVAVTGVSLDKTSLELTEGDEYTLVATVQPANASNKQVSWKSDDETVATVSDGKVKAIKPGNTSITVSTSDGNKTATCSIKVNEKIYHVESVTLDKTSLELSEGDEAILTAAVLPENANNKNILWSSSNENVATVSNGLVKAVAPGTTSIIAKSEDGEKTATCNVTVMEKETIIQFADIVAKYACVEKYDTNGDGEISTKEAAAVKSLDGLFSNWKDVKCFDEIKYFTNVTSIKSLFRDCDKLESITVPDHVNDLGYNTFYGCHSLKQVRLPVNITSIGNSAFRDCVSLETITIPENVTKIESYAFYGCSALKKMSLPEDLTHIGAYVFYSCKALKSIILPVGIDSIPSYAFYQCTSLEEITINGMVQTISSYAFNGVKMWKMALPGSVTSIGDKCFTEVYNLILPSLSYVSCSSNSFSEKVTVFVPDDMVDIYKLRTNWSMIPGQIYGSSKYKEKDSYVLAKEGAVDMGLSVKWAAVNIGATKPEGYGDYFAWGETKPKKTYNRENYFDFNQSYGIYNKYSSVKLLLLEKCDDAANVNWGGNWRIPTNTEAQELVNCYWEPIKFEGINGFMVYGRASGHKIFIPCAGLISDNKNNYLGDSGCYWTSTLACKESNASNAYSHDYYAWIILFNFDPDDTVNHRLTCSHRYGGKTIRPVCD